ncbi:MAG: hypothetical protein JWM27_4564 [Gemmatimonadetes bacterium]|nr:hypothetical protein [Gemmatimonadota bacterium]
MGGRPSNAMPGRTKRAGPTHCTGEARWLQTGSVSTFSPPAWMRNVECPTHVSRSSPSAALGRATSAVATGKCPRGGFRGFGCRRRFQLHRSRSANPRRCSASVSQGLVKRPSGR